MDLPTVDRAVCSFENENDRFLLNGNGGTNRFQEQYFSLYKTRVAAFSSLLKDEAKCQFGENVVFRTLADLEDKENCVVIGTVVKNQELRPSVLKQLAEDVNELPQPLNGNRKFAGDKDKLLLEDDQQTINLDGNVSLNDLCTGIVIAAYGKKISGDVFHVEKLIFPPPPPQKSIPDFEGDRYILFLSGLEMTGREGEDGRTLLAGNLLVDYLTGAIGSVEEHKNSTSKICRLVIAGNSIAASAEDKMFSEQARYLTRKHLSPSVESMRNVDRFLSRLTPFIPVDLLPGENDPTNHMWPQRPLHKCIFPQASRYGTMLNFVPNPFQAKVGGRTIVGTSGQNVDDVYRCCLESDPLTLLRYIFFWQHLCPTAPDTLGIQNCYPLKDDDPFIMSRPDLVCPDILFAGNQSKFQYELIESPDGQRTLLLVLPQFKTSGQAVLVNLRTLKTETLECMNE